MKICGRKFVSSTFWALLVLPAAGCLALMTTTPTPTTTIKTTTGKISTTSSPPPPQQQLSWNDKAKRWVAASMLGASLVLGTNISPVSAATTTEKTTIEVSVETDYLVRALDYFGGDMKKTMTAIVRAPTSTIKIEPPESARDDFLRALYPFAEPEEYAEQINWLGVSVQPKKSIVEQFTSKQFKVGPIGFSLIDVGLNSLNSINLIQTKSTLNFKTMD